MCAKAGGTIISPTHGSGDTCCCYGRDAEDSDRCLPDVPVDTCLGASVQGRCRAEEAASCCCRPAGVVNDLNCIPRIPETLCTKATGAECVTAPTATPVCICTLPRAPDAEEGSVVAPITLPADVCAKFDGECSGTDESLSCCCIFEGAVDAFGNPIMPDPSDPGVPERGECINVLRSKCNESRKRSGVCWQSPTTQPLADRCLCQDPAFSVRRPILDSEGEPDMVLRHVCEDKLFSTCLSELCCCKYPSAPLEPCLANIECSTCFAVNGAVNVEQPPALDDNGVDGLLSTEDIPCDCTTSEDAVDANILRVSSFSTLTTATVDDLGVAKYDINLFSSQLSGSETVYTRTSLGVLNIDVSPAASGFQLFVIDWKVGTGPFQISISPSSTVPGFLSGGAGASFSPGFMPGDYLLTLSTFTTNGIMAFSGPVSSIEIKWPVGTFEDPATQGVIPFLSSSSVLPFTLVTPGLDEPIVQIYDENLPLDPQPETPIKYSGCVACVATDEFSMLPPPYLYNFQDFGGYGRRVVFNFQRPQSPSGMNIFLTGLSPGNYLIQLTGSTAFPPPVIVSGFNGGSGASFDPDNAFKLVVTESGSCGIIAICGQPSRVSIQIPSLAGDAVGTSSDIGGAAQCLDAGIAIGAGTCLTPGAAGLFQTTPYARF